MNPLVELNLALILFLPWFTILAVLFWKFPRAPRGWQRTLFDSTSLLLAMAAAAGGMYWSMANADPTFGHMWQQVLATSVSYGLFLWHPFALEWIHVIGDIPDFTGDPLTIYVLTVAGGLLLAALSFYIVERPFQRLSHRWPRPPRPRTTESQRPVAAASAAS